MFAAVWLFVCLPGSGMGQEPSRQNIPSGIVVLDPGHGGNDHGAEGSDGRLEKQVAMAFSRILAQALKARYRVLLTRTDDYDIPFEDRISRSNYARADLFISIHTGGSPLRHVEGMSFFYYGKEAVKDAASETPLSGAGQSNLLESWETVDPLHVEKSRYLAELIKMRLLEDRNDLKITIMSAPLVIAKGAGMPVLLLEIGYVTNPGDAKKLNNDKILEGYARSVAKAVDDFFSDKLHL